MIDFQVKSIIFYLVIFARRLAPTHLVKWSMATIKNLILSFLVDIGTIRSTLHLENGHRLMMEVSSSGRARIICVRR